MRSVKTLGLLTYLILEPDVAHSREKLASLLWGESTESRARNSLRQALYSVRQSLGEDLLSIDRTTAAFEPRESVWVDATDLRATLAHPYHGHSLEHLQRVVDLYRGTLLEGVAPTACPAFDEWLFFEREDTEQLAIVALQRLTDGLLAQSKLVDAERYTRRLLDLDPLHEDAHRNLMRVYGARNDLDSVRRCYEQLTDLLAEELGLKPSLETQALYESLSTRAPALPIRPSHEDALPVESPSPTLPFVGREQEIDVLGRHFQNAMAGRGRLIFVSGEAGIGKTRLISEFLQPKAAGQGEMLTILKGTCYAPESRSPYGMWADALTYLGAPPLRDDLIGLADVWRQQIARLVPALGPVAEEVPGTTGEENRLRLMQAVVQLLYTLSRRRKLCLWFEDLHWADPASLALLHYVERHLRAASIFVVATYQSESLPDNPDLERLLNRGESVEVIEIKPLSPDAIGQALPTVGIPSTEPVVRQLHQHTGGNALFLTDIIQTLQESGVRRLQVGMDLDPETQLPIPQRIRELLQARLSQAGEAQDRVLSAAAVIGRPFGLRLLRRVSGLTEFEALDAVDSCLRRALLIEPPDAATGRELAFPHDYYRQVVYENLRKIQRHALHRRAADALLELPQRQPQTIAEEVALHYAQAGDGRAVVLLVEAAAHAEGLYATRHAIRLYSRALDFLDRYQPDDAERRFDLLAQRETLLDRQGTRTRQSYDLVAMAELAEEVGDKDRQAYVKVRRAGYLATIGHHTEARQAGDEALRMYRASGDSQGEAHALRELGFVHWSAGDYATALAYARSALELHRRLGSVAGEATALHNLAEIHRTLGSPQQALAQYQAALRLHWSAGNTQREGHSLYGLGHAHRQLGNQAQAREAYEQALACFQAAEDPVMRSRVHHTMAWLAWEEGAIDQAQDHASQALEISQEIGFGLGIAYGHVALGEIAAEEGDQERARRHLTQATTWLELTEANEQLAETRRRLQAIEQGIAPTGRRSLPEIDWVKSHVVLPEGKVYCAFESPTARASGVPPVIVELGDL